MTLHETRLQELVRDRLGLAAPALPSTRFEAAFRKASSILECSEPDDVDELLRRLPLRCDAWQAVIDELVVAETSFFRQKGWYEQLELVIAQMIDRKRRRRDNELTIWSAGCATGEEPYTLAMIVDRLLPDRRTWNVTILGTDANTQSIARAREASYQERSLREVASALRERYFVEVSPKRYRLAACVGDMVSFRDHNLVEPSDWPSNADVVVCRNVLMHLTPRNQRAVARRLVSSLSPEGLVAVTPAEAVSEWFAPLIPINLPGAIFFRRDSPPPSIGSGNAVAAARPPRRAVPSPPDLPGGAPDALGRARTLADAGDLRAARWQCEIALAEDALNFESNLLLAMVCDEMGDFRAALAAARNAVYLVPDSALAWSIMQRACLGLGRPKQSCRLLPEGSLGTA